TVRDPDTTDGPGLTASEGLSLDAERFVTEGTRPPVSGGSASSFGDPTTAPHTAKFPPAAAPAPADDAYHAVEREPRGQVPSARLAALIADGIRAEEWLAWRDGLDGWVKAEVVPELGPFFPRRRPPTPPRGAKREVPRPTDGRLAQTAPSQA